MSNSKQYNRIEDAITDLLHGDSQKNALKLVSYLTENSLTPVPMPNKMDNGETNGYKIPYNGHYLGWILIKESGDWCFQIFNYLDFGEDNHTAESDEEFKKVIYDHVKICKSPCHDQCWRAKDAKIFGKEFKSVCSQHSHDFVNPDERTLEHIVRLIEYSKDTTPYPQQCHPNFL